MPSISQEHRTRSKGGGSIHNRNKYCYLLRYMQYLFLLWERSRQPFHQAPERRLPQWARTSALPACAENSAWRSSPSAQASAPTLRAIEQGSPSVAIGSYATVLLAIGMKDELSHVAANDELGRYLQDQDLEPKKRAPRSARFTFGRGAESE